MHFSFAFISERITDINLNAELLKFVNNIKNL